MKMQAIKSQQTEDGVGTLTFLLDSEWTGRVTRFTKGLLEFYARSLPKLFPDGVLDTEYRIILDVLEQCLSKPSSFVTSHFGGTPRTGYTSNIVVDHLGLCVYAAGAAYDTVRLLHDANVSGFSPQVST